MPYPRSRDPGEIDCKARTNLTVGHLDITVYCGMYGIPNTVDYSVDPDASAIGSSYLSETLYECVYKHFTVAYDPSGISKIAIEWESDGYYGDRSLHND